MIHVYVLVLGAFGYEPMPRAELIKHQDPMPNHLPSYQYTTGFV